MKHLMYLTDINENSQYLGVWKKIKMQEEYFKSQGINVEFYDINKKRNIVGIIFKRLPFTGLYNWRIDKEIVENIDCIYIRYNITDYQQVKSLKKIKNINPNIKILIEIPTYPFDNEKVINYKNFIFILKDIINRRKLHKCVDYILTYSNDKFIFNIPTINLSNAVNSRKTEKITNKLKNKTIDVIAVANFDFWHGYDRFIEGLNSYYSEGFDNVLEVKLHLVGGGEDIHLYKSLVNKYNLNNHVVFHGVKQGKELDEVYEKCEIALDAMGRHRSKVYYNSTLKGKEYGAKGLPIISGVETELDSDKNYKYYMRVPADESKINIHDVINFYNDIYNSNEIKEDVINNIRNYTVSNFDVTVTWKKIADYIIGI